VNEVTINLKLAKLHDDLEEYVEAEAYHRRVVDISRATRKANDVGSRIETQFSCLNPAVKPIAEYAKSCVYVARHHLQRGGGDLELAQEYLEKVAVSNAEDADTATELVKKVKAEIKLKVEESKTMETSSAQGEERDG